MTDKTFNDDLRMLARDELYMLIEDYEDMENEDEDYDPPRVAVFIKNMSRHFHIQPHEVTSILWEMVDDGLLKYGTDAVFRINRRRL